MVRITLAFCLVTFSIYAGAKAPENKAQSSGQEQMSGLISIIATVSGQVLTLSDGSTYQVHPNDKSVITAWTNNKVEITNIGSPDYPFLIRNKDTDTSARAIRVETKP